MKNWWFSIIFFFLSFLLLFFLLPFFSSSFFFFFFSRRAPRGPDVCPKTQKEPFFISLKEKFMIFNDFEWEIDDFQWFLMNLNEKLMILNEKLMISNEFSWFWMRNWWFSKILKEKLMILNNFCAFRAVSTAPLGRQQEQVIFIQKVNILNEKFMILNDFQWKFDDFEACLFCRRFRGAVEKKHEKMWKNIGKINIFHENFCVFVSFLMHFCAVRGLSNSAVERVQKEATNE